MAGYPDRCAGLAQLVEHLSCKEKVIGSNPIPGSDGNDLGLPDEGILVLEVLRADGSLVGASRGRTVIYSYDMLVLCGRSAVLADLTSGQTTLTAIEPTMRL